MFGLDIVMKSVREERKVCNFYNPDRELNDLTAGFQLLFVFASSFEVKYQQVAKEILVALNFLSLHTLMDNTIIVINNNNQIGPMGKE